MCFAFGSMLFYVARTGLLASNNEPKLKHIIRIAPINPMFSLSHLKNLALRETSNSRLVVHRIGGNFDNAQR